MSESADQMLERCAAKRSYLARWADANPVGARRERKHAAAQGHTAVIDDPVIEVRASALEAVCRSALGIEAPPSSDQPTLDFGATA